MLPSWLQIDAGIGTRRGSRKHTLKIVVWYFVAPVYLRSTPPPSSPGESRTLATQGIQRNNSDGLSLPGDSAKWIQVEGRGNQVTMVLSCHGDSSDRRDYSQLMASDGSKDDKQRGKTHQVTWIPTSESDGKSEVSMASLKESISFGHWTDRNEDRDWKLF